MSSQDLQAPVIFAIDLATLNSSEENIFITSDSTPTFSGTAEANSSVELFGDGISLGTTTTDGSGNWSFTVPATAQLVEGTTVITAVASDSADQIAVLQPSVIAPASPGRTTQEYNNRFAFAALKEDGSVVTWGFSSFGGDSSSVSNDLQSGVTQIFSTRGSFAALKDDGSVVTWGSAGGDSSRVSADLQSGVTQIFSTGDSFAALKDDGSVVTWGFPSSGGDSSSVSTDLQSGVTQIFSNESAFAALKDDGSVVTWGNPFSGADSSSVSADHLQSGVTQIFSTKAAFAALKDDGSVITWGDARFGGKSGSLSNDLQSGVTQIFSTQSAFAALKDDGSIITWGNTDFGGDSSSVSADLQSGVTQIFSARSAFAALKDDGSVVTWGESSSGGDSSSVSADLQSGVTQIFSTEVAFAALKVDGSVVTWGGAGGDSSSVSNQLQDGVTQIFSNSGAFAALKDDGSVVTWGDFFYGGGGSSLSTDLQSGVTQIFSTGSAFAALKEDGSVVTWGFSVYGGDSSSVSTDLQSGVVSFADPFQSDRLIFETGADLTSEPSQSLYIIVETPPAAPSTPDLIPSSDSGTTSSDNLTNNATPTFTGTAEANSSVELFAGTTSLGTTTADSSGNWSFTVPVTAALLEGTTAITAVATDSADSTAVLQTSAVAPASPGRTTQEFRNYGAFAALKDDGSVITWGNPFSGADSSSVSADLQSGVTQIFTTALAFAALKDDGSVVTWGNADRGGDSSSVSADLQSGVTQIFTTAVAFAALKDDGSVLTWGNSSNGGDSSSVSTDLQSDVVSFADPFQDDRLVIVSSEFVLTSEALNVTVDTSAPIFTSTGTAAAIDENSDAGQTIYTASTSDQSAVSYTLKVDNGDDVNKFAMDPISGDVSLIDSINFEMQSSYSAVIIATDAAGNSSEKTLSLSSSGISVQQSGTVQDGYIKGATVFSDINNNGLLDWTDNNNNGEWDEGEGDPWTISSETGSFLLSVEADTSPIYAIGGIDISTNEEIDGIYIAPAGSSVISPLSTAVYLHLEATKPSTPYQDYEEYLQGVADSEAVILGQLGLSEEGIIDILNTDHLEIVNNQAGSGRFESSLEVYKVAAQLGSIMEASAESTGSSQVFASAFGLLATNANTINLSDLETISSLVSGDNTNSETEILAEIIAESNAKISTSTTSSEIAFEQAKAYQDLQAALDTTAPVFTSTDRAESIDEHSGSGQVIYSATSIDQSDVFYSLKANNNDDAEQFMIDPQSGNVSLSDDPDFDTQSNYSFVVVATDAAGNSSEKSVALAIETIDDGQGIVGAISADGGASFNEGVILVAGEISGDPEEVQSVGGYQWYLNGAEIDGATAASYSTTALGEGDYTVAVSYTDQQGYQATLDSDVQSVAKVDNGDAAFELQSATTPSTESVSVGDRLEAIQTLDDVDGNLLPGTQFNYAWQRAIKGTQDWSTLANATEDFYTVQNADAGHTIRARIWYTDGQGYDEITGTQSLEIDPLMGTLGGPKKVNLRNNGVTSIALMGSTGIDGIAADKITISDLVFGKSPGDNIKVAQNEKSGKYHCSIDDVNNDGVDDLVVKLKTADLSSMKGSDSLYAYGSLQNGAEIFYSLEQGDSINFF